MLLELGHGIIQGPLRQHLGNLLWAQRLKGLKPSSSGAVLKQEGRPLFHPANQFGQVSKRRKANAPNGVVGAEAALRRPAGDGGNARIYERSCIRESKGEQTRVGAPMSARRRHRSGRRCHSHRDDEPWITRSIASQGRSHCLYQSILKEFLCGAQLAQSALWNFSLSAFQQKAPLLDSLSATRERMNESQRG